MGYGRWQAYCSPRPRFRTAEQPGVVADTVLKAANAAHLTGQFLIYALVGVHVAAALMHAVVRRNGILERMLPLRRTAS